MIDKKQWLLNRRSYLGGSEISAIAGLNPYKTAVDIYLEKISDEAPEEITSEAAHFGILLEDIIAKEYARRTNNTVTIHQEVIRHPEYPFIGANIDRWVNDGEFILECKTTSLMQRDKWGEEGTDSIPEHYLLQCAYYAMICDKPKVDLAVLIGGQNFKLYQYNKNEALENHLLQIAKNFWLNHVEKRIPPQAINLQDINKLYPEANEDSIVADQEIENLFIKLSSLKSQSADIEENIKQTQLQIQNFMGYNSILLDHQNNVLATWKSSKGRTSFDSKTMQKEMPETYEKYLTQGKGYRTFLLKNKGNTNE